MPSTAFIGTRYIPNPMRSLTPWAACNLTTWRPELSDRAATAWLVVRAPIEGPEGYKEKPKLVCPADDCRARPADCAMTGLYVLISPCQALWRLRLSGAAHCRYGTPHSSGTGKGVTIYTLDSGLRVTHQEFRAWDGSGRRGNYGCAHRL